MAKKLEKKTFDFKVKQVTDDGEFQGYVSTFGNVDEGGDIVVQGAFTKTLEENKAFPLLWAHDPSKPATVVGSFHGAEDIHGLLINGNFLPDPDSQNVRMKVKALVDRGVKFGLSIGYKALKFGNDRLNGSVVRRLDELKLYEGSLALFPMNEMALLTEVKAIDMALTQEPEPSTPAVEPPVATEPTIVTPEPKSDPDLMRALEAFRDIALTLKNSMEAK